MRLLDAHRQASKIRFTSLQRLSPEGRFKVLALLHRRHHEGDKRVGK